MKRMGAVGGVLAAVVMVAGCAAPSDPQKARPREYVEPATVTRAAQQAYGAGATEAYQEMSTLILQRSLDPSLLDPQHRPTAAELSDGIVDHLAPRTQTVWNRYVTQAVAGDKTSNETVSLLRLHDVNAVANRPELRLPPNGDVVTSQTISGAKVDVAQKTGTVTPLKISFHHAARLDYRSQRAPFPGSVDRDLTLIVVPAGSSGTATASASTSATPSGTVTVVPLTTGGAQWLITQFEGTSTIDFDQADEPSATSTESVAPSSTAPSSTAPTP